MDREAWWATDHGVAKSQTRLSDFTFFLLSCYGVREGKVQKKNETGTLQEQITFNEARRDSREISELTQEKSKYI